jgi:dihydrofolate reductase
MAVFTLTIVASRDGFIARAHDHPPQAWASAEEQVLFFQDVEAADWVILGRNTHEAADRPERRRIVFSRTTKGWQRPTQLWVDPQDLAPDDLPGLVEHVRPLEHGLILGGTSVHDWFHHHRAISRIHLTIEPVEFGTGLPIFTGQTLADPLQVFERAGYALVSERGLNAAGTRYVEMVPAS